MNFGRDMLDTLGAARDSWLDVLGLNTNKAREDQDVLAALTSSGQPNMGWLGIESGSPFGSVDANLKFGDPGEAKILRDLKEQLAMLGGKAPGAAVKPGKPRTTLDAVGPKVDSGMGKVTTPTVPAPAAPAPVSGGGGAGVLQWKPLVAESATKWGVPQDVILGLVDIESGGNPKAVSKAGAKGLGQIMDFHWTPEQLAAGAPFDPAANIDKIGELMARGIQRYGDVEKAAAAYFGALRKDANGNWVITDASDGNTTGSVYVRKFNEARSKYFAPEEE